MIEGIRAEEIQNTRNLLEHQYQMKKQKKHDKIVNRIRFLRKSCRCRFVCTGLHILYVQKINCTDNFMIWLHRC